MGMVQDQTVDLEALRNKKYLSAAEELRKARDRKLWGKVVIEFKDGVPEHCWIEISKKLP